MPEDMLLNLNSDDWEVFQIFLFVTVCDGLQIDVTCEGRMNTAKIQIKV